MSATPTSPASPATPAAASLSPLSDKALLERAQHGDDEAAQLLARRLFGKVTPEITAALPSLRCKTRLSVHAARRILAAATSPTAASA